MNCNPALQTCITPVNTKPLLAAVEVSNVIPVILAVGLLFILTAVLVYAILKITGLINPVTELIKPIKKSRTQFKAYTAEERKAYGQKKYLERKASEDKSKIEFKAYTAEERKAFGQKKYLESKTLEDESFDFESRSEFSSKKPSRPNSNYGDSDDDF